jgi:PAS domain S-box-containing protein
MNQQDINKLEKLTKAELIKEIVALKKNGVSRLNSDPISLKEAAEMNLLIVENSHDGIMIIDDNYTITFVNNRLCELTGYSKDEITNIDFRELISARTKKMAIKKYEGRKNGKKLQSKFELPIVTKQNKEKIFEIRSTVFVDSKGKLRTLSQFKDITLRKQTEEAIIQSEEKFRSMVETSHLGIIIVDMNFKFEYVNDQFCKIVQKPKNELIGKDFRKFLSDESYELVVKRYQDRQKGLSVPTEYDIKIIRADNKTADIKLSSSVVNFSGEIKTIAQLLDITENKKKEKLQSVLLNISQAVNEVKSLSDFLGIVREELSTIIATQNFYVAMYDKNTDTYSFPYHVDEFDVIDEITQLQLKDSLTDYVRRKNKAILVDSKMQTSLENEGEIKGIVGESCPVWLGTPLVVDNVVVGVMGVQDYNHEEAYNNNDLELLKIVSENVSSAIWKKQIIDKLTESETRYRDFISRSSEGIYRIDFEKPINVSLPSKDQVDLMIEHGVVGECNNSFAKMYEQKSYREIIGKRMSDFYGENISEENFKANLDFVNNNYKVTDAETYEFNAKGEELIILNNSIGIVKDGYLYNIWGIQKNITESKKMQNALQQIAQGISSSIGDSFFKSLVTFIGNTLKIDCVLIAQLSENKKSAESLAIWKNGDLIDNIHYQIKNSPSEFVLDQNKTVLLENIHLNYPNDKFLKKMKINNYMGRPLLNSEGLPIGIIIILQEGEIKNLEFTKSVLEIFASRSSAEIERLQYVKEIVAAKEDAERSNNLKSDFLAQMSHEIRTPVNTILSFTSLLKESLEEVVEDDLKDSFKMIENGGRRLIRTIDLILNVSQIQSGSFTVTPTKLNIISELKDIISEFKQEATKKTLTLSLETDYKSLSVYADSYTLTQIFANLIHNAIKYTKSGSIKVKVEKNIKKEVVVEINDTGVGMNDEFLTKIFEPFSQEETGYTRKFEGTGLGLTLVRNYCELNNAEISVKSKKNEGSTFAIRFKKKSPNKKSKTL